MPPGREPCPEPLPEAAVIGAGVEAVEARLSRAVGRAVVPQAPSREQAGRETVAPTATSALRPNPDRSAEQWAAEFGGRVADGPLEERERASLLAMWQSLDPDLQEETLTALLRGYGIFPETLRAALQIPSAAGS